MPNPSVYSFRNINTQLVWLPLLRATEKDIERRPSSSQQLLTIGQKVLRTPLLSPFLFSVYSTPLSLGKVYLAGEKTTLSSIPLDLSPSTLIQETIANNINEIADKGGLLRCLSTDTSVIHYRLSLSTQNILSLCIVRVSLFLCSSVPGSVCFCSPPDTYFYTNAPSPVNSKIAIIHTWIHFS